MPQNINVLIVDDHPFIIQGYKNVINLIKNLPLKVDKLLGTEKAIITSGGVDLKEIDFSTMRSRLYPNLYIVGDMLNIDRPSGGYSLQLCWTTGSRLQNSPDESRYGCSCGCARAFCRRA